MDEHEQWPHGQPQDVEACRKDTQERVTEEQGEDHHDEKPRAVQHEERPHCANLRQSVRITTPTCPQNKPRRRLKPTLDATSP